MKQHILINGRIYNQQNIEKTSIQSNRIRTTLNLITYIAHRYQHNIHTSENPDHLKRPLEIRPYTSIGDDSAITNTEVENSIIMEGSYIDCGRRITDSLIGRRVRVLSSDQNLPKGHRLILGDMSTVTL